MKPFIRIVSMLFFVVSLFVFAVDANEEKNLKEVTIDDVKGRLELSVPETPAFTALGVTPENVITPGNVHDLALAILEGADKDGNLQRGIAIELSPFAASGSDLSLYDYQNDGLKRFLYRTRISFATSSGKSEENKATRHAIGFRFTPYNEADPRLSLKINSCITEVFEAASSQNQNRSVNPAAPGVNFPASGTVSNPAQPAPSDIQKKVGECISTNNALLWNKKAWDLGAVLYDADDAELKSSGYAIWTSFAFGFGEKDKFILHAKHFDDMLSPDVNADEIMDIQDGTVLSARAVYKVDKLYVMAEGSRIDVDYPNLGREDKYNDFMVGAEIPVYNDIYLQLGYGKRTGSSFPETNENYLSGQIRWALSETSLFGAKE